MRHQTGICRLIASSRGQTMAEYALILVTVAVVAVALVNNAGTILSELVGTVSKLLSP
jgi:Flp pilus assembly pilin Flp